MSALSIKYIGMFRKVVLLEILGNSPSTRATGLESTGCQATKNTLLTKFLKGVLKISVNFHEELYNGVPFQ